jgi:23S rRNA pseudouridine955/2504/2580 synthase
MSRSADEVSAEEEGLRLDRWFRRHYPTLSHGRLERLLRTGQVRVDGRRIKAGHRLVPGNQIRVPPAAAESNAAKPARRADPSPGASAAERRELRQRILHQDASVLAIDKPPGLAVQGGSAVTRHLDAMLEALRFEAEARPKLVHRLDKDTSGVLVLARTPRAAARLARAFREDRVTKIYWAIVVGVPAENLGRIDLPLAKRPGPGGERVRVDEALGRRAVTELAVVDRVGREVAWVALRPRTGRTHQLRAHAAAIGTPILGDGKYGRRQAFLEGFDLSPRLHLHARSLRLPHPDGGELELTAPLPPHFAETMKRLGFATADHGDPFPD